MGEVWRALKLTSASATWKRSVALKVILPSFADVQTYTEMFINEAQIAAGLTHANIVAVSDFGLHDGTLFLEQELVDGTDLAHLIARYPTGVPAPIATFVVLEALKGLAYAHSHTGHDGIARVVIHRDIKPGNILLAREGNVKLTDFGIAKLTAGTASITDLRGTIGYIAPELLRGQPPSRQSDIFAMGLILWELLTGKKLFDGSNEAEKLFKTFECIVPMLASENVQAPPALEAVLRQMLARETAHRFASAEATIEALLQTPLGRAATSLDLRSFLLQSGALDRKPSQVVENDEAASPPTPTRPPAPAGGTVTLAGQVSPGRPGRRRRKLLAAGALVACLGGVTTAVVTSRRASTKSQASKQTATAAASQAIDAGSTAPPDARGAMPASTELAQQPAAIQPQSLVVDAGAPPRDAAPDAPPAEKPKRRIPKAAAEPAAEPPEKPKHAKDGLFLPE